MRDNDSPTEEHSRALEMLMNPPTVAPVVDNATQMFFPDCSLAYDEELGRLHEARRKASGNAEMMREMEGDYFSVKLFDQQTGQTVSALDARCQPGGALSMATGSLRLELGPSSPTLMVHYRSLRTCLRSTRTFRLLRCHSVYVSIFQLQIALRVRGLGAFPISQLAVTCRFLRAASNGMMLLPNLRMLSLILTECIWLLSSSLECSEMIRLLLRVGVMSPE